jgi:hypothetical protein
MNMGLQNYGGESIHLEVKQEMGIQNNGGLL